MDRFYMIWTCPQNTGKLFFTRYSNWPLGIQYKIFRVTLFDKLQAETFDAGEAFMLTPNDQEEEFNLKLVVSKEGGIKTEGTTFTYRKHDSPRQASDWLFAGACGWLALTLSCYSATLSTPHIKN